MSNRQFQQQQKSLLNNNSTSKFFNNIGSKKHKLYKKANNNLRSCKQDNSTCKTKKQSYKVEISKKALYRLSSTYKKKLISMLTTTFGFTKSNFKKTEIEEIAKYLDILNKVYNDYVCESGITMNTVSKNGRNNRYFRNSSNFRFTSRNSKTIDMYQYLINKMNEQLPDSTIIITSFINNIKTSNKNTTNPKPNVITNVESEKIMNDSKLISIFKKVLENLPDCKAS
jgi:hypothetical protein